jgi:solute carrier family 25 phosphate transporter 3
MLISMATAASLLPVAAYAATLEDIQLGKASWTSQAPSDRLAPSSDLCPAPFCTYLARFLINYDAGVQSWWQDQLSSTALLPPGQQKQQLCQAFGKFSASLQQGLDNNLGSSTYTKLLQRLLDTYSDPEAARHVGILAALIPPNDQPQGQLRQRLLKTKFEQQQVASRSWTEDLGSLLPSPYHVVFNREGSLSISPPLPIYPVGLDNEFGQSGTSTPFGPRGSALMIRELPCYSPRIYTILGVSGAAGCALTHSLVIPLDVLKTKAQADPDGYSNLVQGANKILDEEGFAGLVTGAQATLAGYFWYGLSVYPSYSFFKRCFSGSPWAVAHYCDVALIAGALASVIASLGLTPLEAARIRVVADPAKYKSLGLVGTLKVIAGEDALYAGLPSLLTRQIIFGSVKFLAFERACEAIYTAAPSLRDTTWTALTVSLVAGGISGTLSSIVSQPADSVLTYVAQANGNLGLISSARIMIQTGGIGALFQGLGCRCVWAGSIIAGQFLLYDVFRTLFGVTANDLSQVLQVDIY